MVKKVNEKMKGLNTEIDSVAWTVGDEAANVVVVGADLKDYEGTIVDAELYLDVYVVKATATTTVDSSITIAIDTATDGGNNAVIFTAGTQGLAKINSNNGQLGIKCTKTAAGTAYLKIVGYDGVVHTSDTLTWT